MEGVRATHADMRMRINTAHLATASVLLRVQTTPALPSERGGK